MNEKITEGVPPIEKRSMVSEADIKETTEKIKEGKEGTVVPSVDVLLLFALITEYLSFVLRVSLCPVSKSVKISFSPAEYIGLIGSKNTFPLQFILSILQIISFPTLILYS